MKKLIILILLLTPFLLNAQEKLSVVKLKSGTEITGVIKSINPTEALTIVIAGVETEIKMADVAKIDVLDNSTNTTINKEIPRPQLMADEKLIVTDFAEYPDSFDLIVGDSKIKMVLVRGGEMNMGFDGRHSRSMDSEPVHKVILTTFYISESFVTNEIISNIKGKKGKKGYYYTPKWEEANKMVEMISETSGIPLKLPTEAEWEYTACSSVQEQVFKKCHNFEYCSDWYDHFSIQQTRVDPQGPINGKRHVIRAYDGHLGKLNRSLLIGTFDNIGFRLVVKAKEISK